MDRMEDGREGVEARSARLATLARLAFGGSKSDVSFVSGVSVRSPLPVGFHKP